MTTKNSPQQQAVYDSEHALRAAGLAGPLMSDPDEIKWLFNLVIFSEKWEGPRDITLNLVKTGDNVASASEKVVQLNIANGTDSLIMIHELTHIYVGRGKGHGGEFTRALLRHVYTWLGSESYVRLHTQYRSRGVEVL